MIGGCISVVETQTLVSYVVDMKMLCYRSVFWTVDNGLFSMLRRAGGFALLAIPAVAAPQAPLR